MYKLSSTAKTSFKSYVRQTAKITFYGSEETTVFTEADVIQSSLSVDRYTVTGDELELGSAVSAELTFNLNNRDGQFDNLALEGAELFAQIYVGNEFIPLGYFTVNGSPRHLRTIEITADDRMVKFDQPVNESYFYDNATVASYIRSCCEACGITLATDIDSLPNADYKIPTFPGGDITYRTVLQWCAAIMGTCAYIDWNGYLRFEWYADNITGETISPSERYDSDIYENDIVITGITATVTNDDGDDEEYISGTNDYALDLSDCQILQSAGDVQSAIDTLGAKLIGFTYRPYSCETKPMPWLYPLDTINFVDKNGVTHSTIITNATFTMNAHSSFEGKGETATSNSYYQQTLTARISQILNNTKKNTVRLTSAETMLAAFNDTLANASGLYSTTVTASDKSVTYYFHDKSELENSNVIYMFNSGGFAWTTSGWNDGSPTWQYGFDSNGDGILNNVLINYLQAHKLTADEVNVANIVGAINDSSGDSELVISADHIDINGVISANGTFTVDESGYLTCTGGTIAGLIIASYTDELTNETVKRLANPSDTFHIEVTENKNGVATNTEVLITDLLCDSVTSNTCDNKISFNYTDNSITYTLTLTFDSESTSSASYKPVYITITCEDSNVTKLQSSVSYYVYYYKRTGSSYSSILNPMKRTLPVGSALNTPIQVTTEYCNQLLNVSFEYVSSASESAAKRTLEVTQANNSNYYIGVTGSMLPTVSATYNLGLSNSMWKDIWVSTGAINGSDRNIKNSIAAIDEKYSILFDNLKPVTYKLNAGESDRKHTGFIAQEVKDAIETAGLTSKDFAGYCAWETKDGSSCGLRYSEFIALCVNEIQRLKKRIDELEIQFNKKNSQREG